MNLIMDTFYIIVFIFIIGIVITYLFSIKYVDKKLNYNVRKLWFYFRWFLIGKYHCDTTPMLNKFYRLLNKLFWGLVVISITLLIAQIIQGF